ncbi:hypothetical protein [Parvicella tangerina]|uniref:Lipoprotein n=1 Tax=Parvicella tangerina TaxID=2829795 RepID=A0A916JKU3_9FLAO|nr:hypothetical protein [Parvicella tangerina]CAG5078867.1 hypothetical protein CRYO30217_00791 [Parvicella tangerina]
MMNFKQLAIALSLGVLFFTSCGGWTEEDQRNFMDLCEKKSERAYCDCALGKMMEKFDSFEDITEDEGALAEILSSEDCLALEEK